MAQNSAKPDAPAQTWLQLVQEQVRSLRYGLVQIVVHDGRVVQVERTERVRLEQPACADAESEKRIGSPDFWKHKSTELAP